MKTDLRSVEKSLEPLIESLPKLDDLAPKLVSLRDELKELLKNANNGDRWWSPDTEEIL